MVNLIAIMMVGTGGAILIGGLVLLLSMAVSEAGRWLGRRIPISGKWQLRAVTLLLVMLLIAIIYVLGYAMTGGGNA